MMELVIILVTLLKVLAKEMSLVKKNKRCKNKKQIKFYL